MQSSPWEVRLSNSKGVHYFYNRTTSESRWEPPSELSKSAIASLPGGQDYLNATASKTQPAASLGGKPGQVRASHLLVKHAGSRRPSSWKEVSGNFFVPSFNVCN